MRLDPYEILQVSPSAEPEVIEGAYRRLARKYHPDVNPSPDAAARMKEINWAYEILSDPQKRAMYDAQRRFVRTSRYQYPPSPRAARPSYQPPKEPYPRPTARGIVRLMRALGPVIAVLVPMFIVLAFAASQGAFRSVEPSSYRTPTLSATLAPSPTFTPQPTHTPRPTIVVTPSPTSSPTCTALIVHVVQPGETLSVIASLYGITADAICAFNELTDCSLITPGQELMIPGEGVVLPSPTKPATLPSPTAQPTPTPIPPPTEGIMQVMHYGTTWDVRVVSIEKATMLKSTFSDDVTYAAGEYWILSLEVTNRGRRTDSFIVVDLALQPPAGGAVYEEDWRATLYVEAARGMDLAAYKIHPGEVGYTVKVFDVPVGTTELILMSQGIVSRSEGAIVVRP